MSYYKSKIDFMTKFLIASFRFHHAQQIHSGKFENSAKQKITPTQITQSQGFGGKDRLFKKEVCIFFFSVRQDVIVSSDNL